MKVAAVWRNAFLLAGVTTLSLPLRASGDIQGIAHVALNVKRIEQSRRFFGDLLGFKEPFSTFGPDGSLRWTFIKINDTQFLELFPNKEPEPFRHMALLTTDIAGLHARLRVAGVIVPDNISTGENVGKYFFVQDPEGRPIEFVEYISTSRVSVSKGQDLGWGDASPRLTEVELPAAKLAGLRDFYGAALRLTETKDEGQAGDAGPSLVFVMEGTKDRIRFMTRRSRAANSAGAILLTAHTALSPERERRIRQVSLRVRPASASDSRIEARCELQDPDGTTFVLTLSKPRRLRAR